MDVDAHSNLRAALLLGHEILVALGGDLRRIISRRSWTRRVSTIGFPFSSEKTMIDHLILRLETFPQDGGTRPGAAPETCRAPSSQSRGPLAPIPRHTSSRSAHGRPRRLGDPGRVSYLLMEEKMVIVGSIRRTQRWPRQQ